MKIFTTLLLLTLLSACGGSGGDSNPAPITPVEPALATQDVLADPNATFKTFQQVNFMASNDSALNVTLYIYDDSLALLARRYIASQGSTEVVMQLPAASENITLHWHYRELVKQQQVNLIDTTSSSFSGFE